MLEALLLPALLLGGMGLLFGVGLGFASVKFRVDDDPKLALIREALPGANCGGCGYAGCDAFAESALKGTAKPGGCPVGGETSAGRIAGVLGVPAGRFERKQSFVRCGGCESKSVFRYDYWGMNDCGAAMQLAGGGSKGCVYGCLGAGSCRAACRFGAISLTDGIAAVDPEKCTACGMCVKVCPKNLIALVPYMNNIHVCCHSNDPGRGVRVNCKVGCIGCKLCEKACKYGAIRVSGNLAVIDYAKCTQCGECMGKCPSKCIISVRAAGK